jgi:GNAT superfamily N-acetyltransferase
MLKLKSLLLKENRDDVIERFKSLLPKYGLEFYSWDNNPDNVAFQWRGGTYPTVTDKDRIVKVALDSTDIFSRRGEVWVGDPSRPMVHGFVIQAIVTNPEHRGKGKAKEMLRKVLAAADEAGLLLKLEPVPMKDFIKKGQKNVTKNQLQKWYGGMGFERDPEANIMTRKPQQT